MAFRCLFGFAGALAVAFFASACALAQFAQPSTLVVPSCGTLPANVAPYLPGTTRQQTVDTAGTVCNNASGGGGGTVSQGAAGSASNAWFFQPGAGATFTNPSIGANGATAPSSSTQIAGPDSVTGNLTAAQTVNGALDTTLSSGTTVNVATILPTDQALTGTTNLAYSGSGVNCAVTPSSCSFYNFSTKGVAVIKFTPQISSGGYQAFPSTDCLNFGSSPIGVLTEIAGNAQATNSGPQTTMNVSQQGYIIPAQGANCVQIRQNGGTGGVNNTFEATANGAVGAVQIINPLLTEPPWQSYDVDVFGLTGVLSVAGPVFVMTPGTVLTRLAEIRVSCTATAAGNVAVALRRRTTTISGGTSNAITTLNASAGSTLQGVGTARSPGQSNTAATFAYYSGGTAPTFSSVSYPNAADTRLLSCVAGTAGVPTTGSLVETDWKFGPAQSYAQTWQAKTGTIFTLEALSALPTGVAVNLHVTASEQNQ